MPRTRLGPSSSEAPAMHNDSGAAIISIIGPHAGEELRAITERKRLDISRVGWTLWAFRSRQCSPDFISRLAPDRSGVPVFFVSAASPGGAKDTVSADPAREFSANGSTWARLPVGLGPVTARLPASAFVLQALEDAQPGTIVDMGEWQDAWTPGEPPLVQRGASTVCVRAGRTSGHRRAMKSPRRGLLAVGYLEKRGAVWIR